MKKITKKKLERMNKDEIIKLALKQAKEIETLKNTDESDLARYLRMNGYYDVNHQFKKKDGRKRYYIAGIEYLLRASNGTGDIMKMNKREIEQNFEKI